MKQALIFFFYIDCIPLFMMMIFRGRLVFVLGSTSDDILTKSIFIDGGFIKLLIVTSDLFLEWCILCSFFD
jgi:hypothetical protein